MTRVLTIAGSKAPTANSIFDNILRLNRDLAERNTVCSYGLCILVIDCCYDLN